MDILSLIRRKFGEDLDQDVIRKALSYPENKLLARVGNDALDLCNSLLLFDLDHFSNHVENTQVVNVTRSNHSIIVNQDKEFVNFLIDYDYESNNQRRIGVDRADTYIEAIIGAIFLKDGLEGVASFTSQIYNTS